MPTARPSNNLCGAVHTRRRAIHGPCGSVHGRCGVIHDDRGSLRGRCGGLHEHPGAIHEHPGTIHDRPGAIHSGYGAVFFAVLWPSVKPSVCRVDGSVRRGGRPAPGHLNGWLRALCVKMPRVLWCATAILAVSTVPHGQNGRGTRDQRSEVALVLSICLCCFPFAFAICSFPPTPPLPGAPPCPSFPSRVRGC